jgi:hypothetical protein
MNEPIPKRILQVWGGGRPLPLLGKAVAANIRLMNPDFEYVQFDDSAMNAFVSQYYPQYEAFFQSLELAIQRYDFFRYLAVYQLGGFYFDFDVLLAERLDQLLAEGCVFPFERLTWTDYLRAQHSMDWEVGNYAFGAVSGHPFLASVIKNCVRARTDKRWSELITKSIPRLLREELLVIYSTGPGMVSRTLAEYSDVANPVRVLFPPDVCDRGYWNRFGNYGIHLGNGSWRVSQSVLRRRLVGFLGRRNEERAIKLAKRLGQTRPLRPLPTIS